MAFRIVNKSKYNTITIRFIDDSVTSNLSDIERCISVVPMYQRNTQT